MYILLFNLKELLLLQNVYEVKQSTPALRRVFTICVSTRQNGLVTQCIIFIFSVMDEKVLVLKERLRDKKTIWCEGVFKDSFQQ